jgi:hypothetical protein
MPRPVRVPVAVDPILTDSVVLSAQRAVRLASAIHIKHRANVR